MTNRNRIILLGVPLIVLLLLFAALLNHSLRQPRTAPGTASAAQGQPSIEIRSSGGDSREQQQPAISAPPLLPPRTAAPALTPAPGEHPAAALIARITGRVLDAAEHPAPNVEVRLIIAPNQPSAIGTEQSAISGRQGEFQLGPLEFNAEFGAIAVAETPGGALAFSERLKFSAAQTSHSLELRLSPAAALKIRVESEAQTPIAGAAVRAVWRPALRWSAEPRTFTRRTDAGGLCEFSPPGRGQLEFEVSAENFLPEQQLFEFQEKVEMLRVTLHSAHTLAGTLRDDLGYPIAGARIDAQNLGTRLHPGAGAAQRGAAVTDENGAWRIAALLREEYLLTAGFEKSGAPDNLRETIRRSFTGIHPPAENVELIVPRHAQLRAQIIDAQTGKPVESIQLTLESVQPAHAEPLSADVPPQPAEEDAAPRQLPARLGHISGSANCPGGLLLIEGLPSAIYTLNIEKIGFERVELTSLELQSPEVLDLGPIELIANSGIIGRVIRESDRQPLAGVRLYLSSAGPAKYTRSFDDGRFQFFNLESGNYLLKIQERGFRELPQLPVRYSGSGLHDLGDILLGTGQSISGRVLDDRRSPLSGARVRAVPADDPGQRGPAALTDDNGWFQLTGLKAQTWRVQAEHFSNAQRNYAELDVDLLQVPDAQIELIIRRDASLRVILSGDAELDPAGHEIQIRGHYLQSDPDFPPSAFFLTIPGGQTEFVFSNLSAGEYLLMLATHDPVWNRTYRSGRLLELPPGENELEVRLIDREIRCLALDADSFEPLDHASLTFQQRLHPQAHLKNYFLLKYRFQTDEKGFCVTRGLQAEPYDVWVKRQGAVRGVYYGTLDLTRRDPAQTLELRVPPESAGNSSVMAIGL